MLEFYRIQQLANQRGLLCDKYRYRTLPEPPTPKVESSRDLSFQQRLPVAKYDKFLELYWDNDLEARPEDSIETEPPNDQTLPLTPKELPAEEGDARQHPITVLDDADETKPERPEGNE